MPRSLARTSFGFGILLAALPQCRDSKEEELLAAELAGYCGLDSDCEDPLVCAFGRCHVACNEDRDCRRWNDPNVGRCVRVAGKDSPGVCQLEEEGSCRNDRDCEGEQLCADDDQCRDACSDSEPCVSDDLACSASGYCARSEELGQEGELLGAGGGAAAEPSAGGTGAGGSGNTGSGGAGTAGDGAEAGAAGAVPGEGGAAGAGAAAEPSAGGTGTGGNGNTGSGGAGTAGDGAEAGAAGAVPGEGGAAGAGGGLATGGEGGGGGAPEPTEVSESEPNDDRNAPNPIATGVDVLGELTTVDDQDFYEVTAPSSPAAGGYFEVGVTDLPSGTFRLRLWSKVASTTFLNEGTSMSGNAMWAFFAAAPGESYLVEVAAFSSGQPHPYRLTVSYVPISDAFEPNDTRTQAEPITLGQAVIGYLFSGLRANTVSSGEYDDWYEIELEPGEVTLSLTSVPADLSTRVYLYGLQGQSLDDNPQGTGGADNVLTYDIQSGGTHWVRVGTYVPSPVAAGRMSRPGDVPENFLDSYTLTVTQ